jgi:hypothetical protein
VAIQEVAESKTVLPISSDSRRNVAMTTNKPNLTLITLASILGIACSSGSGGGRDGGLGDFGFGNEQGPISDSAGSATVTRHTGGARSSAAVPVPAGGSVMVVPVPTGGLRGNGGAQSVGTIVPPPDTGGVVGIGGGRSAAGGTVAVPPRYTGGTNPTGGTWSTGGRPSTAGATACNGQALLQGRGTLTVSSGYVTTGTLQGYAFTWVGSSSNSTTCITPSCGTAGCTPAFGANALCAAGVVTADATNSSVVGVGFYLNQPIDGSTGGSVAAPPFVTLIVTKGTSAGDLALRVQIVDAAGSTYCVEAGQWSSGIAIPIGSFNSSCWDGTGTPLTAGTPITSINIVIPSDATTNRPFADCLAGVTFVNLGAGGAPSFGGAPGIGGRAAGGLPGIGGGITLAGRAAAGGLPGIGGGITVAGRAAAGGLPSAGGGLAIGGRAAAGGPPGIGGMPVTGGSVATGGLVGAGGTVTDAGAPSTGGTSADASLLATGGLTSSAAAAL